MNAAAPAKGWHAGERALQARAGVAARMEPVGSRFLRDHMPDQHREFFALLPFVLAGTVDRDGQPRVSLLTGEPGFAHSPQPRVLRLDTRESPRGFAQEGVEDLVPGAPIGLLGLQAHTRRRNRMNGWIESIDPHGFSVRVGQSFGNCPKYIHPREAVRVDDASALRTSVHPELDTCARALVARSDTFFIATAHPAAGRSDDPAEGVDVSHRGGPAGFVRVEDARTLLVRDYVGNSFFNTFGNLQLEPRCALLFIDFETGERLHVLARGEVRWDAPDLTHESASPAATSRTLRLAITQVTRTRGGLPLRWREA